MTKIFCAVSTSIPASYSNEASLCRKMGFLFFQNQIDKNEQTNYNHINLLGRLVINKKGDHENARETFGKGEHAHVL